MINRVSGFPEALRVDLASEDAHVGMVLTYK